MDKKQNVANAQSWRVARALSGSILSDAENRVWSPSCVASLLAVAREGASGLTRGELDRLMGEGSFIEERDPFGLEKEGDWGYDSYDASYATAAWLSKSAKPDDTFLRKSWECGIHVTFDDLGDPRVGREVTEWISEQTRGLLAPSVNLSSLTLACLVGALYLKDAWDAPFEGSLTEVKPFHALSGDMAAAFMRGERDCVVIDSDNCVAFMLPLSSGGWMAFALNDDGSIDIGFALDMFERLTCKITDWESVELGIPRFECETTVSDLDALLEDAGVSTASGMELVPMVGAGSTPAQLIHGAKLAVDEDGVEAGAYTMMVVCTGLPPEDPPEPRKIFLDKPFAVGLLSRTGAPLFVGTVVSPSEDTFVWRDIADDENLDV